MTKKLIIVFTLPLLILIGIVITGKKKVSQRPSPGESEIVYSKKSSALMQKWGSEVFVPIVSQEELKKGLADARIEEKITISPDQKNLLLEAVSGLVWGYHEGNYESYMRFRMPITNGYFDKNLTKLRLQVLKKAGGDIGGLSADNPEKVFRAFWNHWNEKDQLFCTKCLKEISYNNAEITVDETAVMPETIKEYIEKRDNVGTLDLFPSFLFSPWPSDLIKTGNIRVATVSLLVKNPVDKPYPIYSRFYWADQYKKWLPFQFGTATSYPVSYSFVF